MNIPRKQIKYGHSSGHSDFCYSSDGSKIISCGSDGDIRIWNGLSDNDPTTTCAGSEWARSIKQVGEFIYCSTEDCKVQILTYPDLDRVGVLIRPTAPVNQIVSSQDNKFVAICTEEMSVKLINLETNEKVDFYGLTGIGLSVAICPKMQLLASTSSEGKLRVYNISNQTIVKEVKCNYKANCFSNAQTLARIQFEPMNGAELAYPDDDKVYIMDVTSWQIQKTLTCDKLAGVLFSIVQYSPCGRFIAAAASNGDVAVWLLKSGSVVTVSLSDDKSDCTALCWNPTNNGELLYSDKNGQFGIFNIQIAEFVSKQNDKIKHFTAINQNDVDDDDANDIFKDRDEDGSEDELAFTKTLPSDEDDDENVVSIEKLKRKHMGVAQNKDKDNTSTKSRSTSPERRVPLQEPFMPTSSPVHLDRRYMCWNHVAIIRCYNTDLNTTSSIEVDFHDANFHSNITMPNFNDYTMGSVSSEVLVTANKRQFYAMPLKTGNITWTKTVREIENIICLSTSDNMICIGTDLNLIHVYTVYGNQKSVLTAPGPIVSMSSHGQYVLIAYHQSATRSNDQVMGIMLIKFNGMNMDCRYLNAPLSPGSTLKWLGFSDKGSPGTFDSEGFLFLYPFQSNVWIPFLDTKLQFASPTDTLFVTSVYESTATIRGTKCRSGVYPALIPRPVLLEIPLQPPFVEISTDKGSLESNLFMWSTLNVENTDKKYKETALKSFVLSCKSDVDMRAFELIENLNNPQILNLAIKYATKMQRTRLVEKLMQINLNCADAQLNTSNTPDNNEIIALNTRILKPKQNSTIQNNKNGCNKKSTDTTSQELFCTATDDDVNEQTSTANSEAFADSPAVVQRKLPFLKSVDSNRTYNPLSLTDTFAGVGKITSNTAEKRKKTNSPPDKREKQRKLDRFIFNKR